jgi:hypothetical protein
MKSITQIFDDCAVELCRRVGLCYPPSEKDKPYKVDDATWTIEEEQDFAEWMKKYLKSCSRFKIMGKNHISKEVDFFLFSYGWKYKKEEK